MPRLRDVPKGCYRTIINLITIISNPGNLVESYNVFELVASKEQELKAKLTRKWNTAMSKKLAFGPSPGEVPWFVLTAKWTQLKVGGSWSHLTGDRPGTLFVLCAEPFPFL